MNNFQAIQDLRLVFLSIWLMLMLYGFYKYCRHTELRTISLLHYIFFSSLSSRFLGFLTGMFVIDVGFVLVLFFTDIFIKVGRYYVVDQTMQVAMLLLTYFSAVIIFYYLTKRCKDSTLAKLLTSFLLIGVFLLGIKGFFYYLEHHFRK